MPPLRHIGTQMPERKVKWIDLCRIQFLLARENFRNSTIETTVDRASNASDEDRLTRLGILVFVRTKSNFFKTYLHDSLCS